ncbi:adenylate/guanylate cyclase domain-containing protein [Nocardioides jejuensis]|nr:adenylate/guanylate cyclase domain-containing protein [Nocardioides jejuensis]
MEFLAPWLWARYRAHYAGLLIFQLLFWPVFVIGIGMIAWAIALHRTFTELIYVGGTFILVTEIGGAISLLLSTREARLMLNRWGRGDQTDPRRTRAALNRLDRIPLIWGLAGGLPMLAVAPLLGNQIGLTWPVNLAMALSAAALVIGSGILGSVIAEAALWPVQTELDVVLREDTLREPRRAVAGRLLTIILLASIMGCWVVALVVSYARTDAQQYVLAPLIALPFAIGTAIVLAPFGVGPVMRPIRDLREGTERVALGILDRRVPVTSDDEFGQLARSFNRMQAGLLERERLQSAFGAYVDPMLAQRLLERGSELFEGEEVEASVVFIDVVGFTAFSQSSTAAETVARLNELFGIAVPILRGHGGHANKFLGDGMLAVFGVPEVHDDHADRAVAAATEIQDAVHARFGDDLAVGIGIASGPVIAGTVGGGGKLEFTLVGDTVNVAARIEELTRLTGDPILLADSTAKALTAPAHLEDRGERELRGRAGGVVLHALTQW